MTFDELCKIYQESKYNKIEKPKKTTIPKVQKTMEQIKAINTIAKKELNNKGINTDGIEDINNNFKLKLFDEVFG